jgi:hypothetical protein
MVPMLLQLESINHWAFYIVHVHLSESLFRLMIVLFTERGLQLLEGVPRWVLDSAHAHVLQRVMHMDWECLVRNVLFMVRTRQLLERVLLLELSAVSAFVLEPEFHSALQYLVMNARCMERMRQLQLGMLLLV